MPESKRELLIAEYQARLEGITVVGGFNTNAGAAVNMGYAPAFGPDDEATAIAVLIGDDDAPRWQGESVLYNLPIEIQALGSAGENTLTPWIVIEAILADIKRAIERPALEDRRFARLLAGVLERGPTRTLRREPGSNAVGLSITYLNPIKEKWGEP